MIKYRIGNSKDIMPISKLLIETWQNAYKDFIPSTFLNNLDLEKQVRRHKKYMALNTKYFIAENEKGQIIGFTSYGKNRFENIDGKNELYTLYVDVAHHGNGIGYALLNLVLSDLEPTQKELLVSVIKKNPFKYFYTRNGFIKIEEEMIDLEGFELTGEIYRRE